MQRLETRSWQLMTNITTMQWFCTQQFIVHITWLFLPHNDILCQFRKRRQFTRTASMAITAWLIRPFSSHFCIFLGFQCFQQFQIRLDHNVLSLLQPTRFQYSRILVQKNIFKSVANKSREISMVKLIETTFKLYIFNIIHVLSNVLQIFLLYTTVLTITAVIIYLEEQGV